MADFKFGSLIERIVTTATAAGTTTLVNTSATLQQFTGSAAQTVQLPDATTLVNGWAVTLLNRSTGALTVNYNDTTNLSAVPGGTQTTFTLVSNSTTNGVWDISTSSGGGGGSGGPLSYWSGYNSNTNSQWQNSTSGSFSDFTSIGGTPTIVQRTGNIIVTAAGSNLPGITFSPASSSAVYLIGATVGVNTASGDSLAVKLTDGTNDISVSASTSSTGNDTSITIVGTYAPGTTSPVTVKLVGEVGGGTATIGSIGSGQQAIEWFITRIDLGSSGTGPFPAYLTANGGGTFVGSNTFLTASCFIDLPNISGSIWELEGDMQFAEGGVAVGWVNLATQWSTSDGANNGTQPATPSASFGINAIYYQIAYLGSLSQAPDFVGGRTNKLHVAGNQRVYLVPYATYNNAGVPTVQINMKATRIA